MTIRLHFDGIFDGSALLDALLANVPGLATVNANGENEVLVQVETGEHGLSLELPDDADVIAVEAVVAAQNPNAGVPLDLSAYAKTDLAIQQLVQKVVWLEQQVRALQAV